MGIKFFNAADVQLAGHGLAQAARAHAWIGQVGQLIAFAVQLLEEGAADQRLAGAYLASDFDKAFTLAKRHVQHIKAGLIRRQLDEKLGIGGQGERFLAQTKVGFVHGRT